MFAIPTQPQEIALQSSDSFALVAVRRPAPLRRLRGIQALESAFHGIAQIWAVSQRVGRQRSGSQQRKFIQRSLRDPMAFGAHCRFVESFARQHRLPAARLQLVEKTSRPYAFAGLVARERMELIRSHYQLASARLPRLLLEEVWSGARYPLGTLVGKCQRAYGLTLDNALSYPKEGELCFAIEDADGQGLARLTCLLVDTHTGPGVLIGGLQGLSGEGAKDRIVTATRDLSGLRPKMAVFVAAMAFARAVGAARLLAVSNRTHVLATANDAQKAKVRADYDAFWIERNGQPNDVGFELPLDAPPRASRSARNQQRETVAALVASHFV